MLKRTFDFLTSLVLLILFSPLLLLISVLISVDSRGKVFFIQQRVGLNNIEFGIIKFRTMHSGAEAKGQLTVSHRDPRITRIGYFLRKYKFDELPQLVNVLKGDMSLVGPRPEVRKYVDFYQKEQLKVLSVRPGITDYASIEYADENERLAASLNPEQEYIESIMPAKLQINLRYIEEQSFLTDLRILFLTLIRIVGK
ncbi:MAG: sugar transferase [Bacteroidia bacterium]|nr:sugar transferase [Bacteroidia bacterium]MCZ2276958.1 sugar transferase [Bacteroidia bacterium]